MATLFNAMNFYSMQMPNVANGLKKLPVRDQAAVQASRDIQLEMARQVENGGFVVDQMVAALLESRVFKEIDSPNIYSAALRRRN